MTFAIVSTIEVIAWFVFALIVIACVSGALAFGLRLGWLFAEATFGLWDRLDS